MTSPTGLESMARREKLEVEPLRMEFRGELLREGDPGYEDARRIWNGDIDRRPAVIARCTGAADVRAAIRFARERDLLVSVRGGGHNVGGTAVCDDGLMIDLSPMKGIRVDPGSRTARAEPGLLWGEFDRETQAFGLAAPGGIISHTGIAGLTLGGGIGWLMRKHGLTCDNLIAADVVTSDGELVRTSEDDEPDLLWGLRGGGGNYGVVTSFEYRLHPVGPLILAGPVVFAAEDAADVLRFYREWIAEAPDGLGTLVNLRVAPGAPWLPTEVHGRRVVMVEVCFVGDLDEGERVVAPLRRFGDPLVDVVTRKPHVANQVFFDATVPHGWRYYWKSHYLPPLSDALIDVLVEGSWQMRHPQSYTLMFHMGGRVRAMSGEDAAFEGRDALHAININGVSVDPGEDPDLEWVRRMWEAVEPHSTGGVYVNFLGFEGQRGVRAAYGEATLRRLVVLKDRYDPTNFFRMNQNVKPSRSRA